MSFANINLGTTAGDNSGDPLRVAFDKINRNFYQITTGNTGVTITSPVNSVAGRTGNVTLTVADVPGAVTPGQVTAIVLGNLDGYANIDYVNTRLPNISTVNDTVSAAIDAEDLPGIRNSITSLQNQITTNSNDISALETADTVLSSRITGANAAIVTANTAMKAYVDAKDSVLTSAVAGAWATANAAISGSSLNDVIADIAEINANVAGANLDIYWLSNTVNNGLLPSVTNLWANLAAANTAATTSNLGMKSYVDAVTTAWTANATTQLQQITGANAAIVTANAAMKSYVDVKVGEIADAWLANAATQAGQIADAGTAIVTANTALKNYTDNQITTANTALKNYVDAQNAAITVAWSANAATQLSQLTAANAAIVTANTAMKDYVDAVTTAWTSNAATQQNQLDSLTANASTQQNTLNQHSANITLLTDTTIALAGAITQINTGSGFATVPQLSANVSAINGNVAALAANVAIHTANISYILGNLSNVSSDNSQIVANLLLLRSNAVIQHQQILSANTFNNAQTVAFNNQMSANIIAANLAISGLTSSVNDIVSDVTSLESTVTGLLIGGIYAYSNSNVASYLPVDSTIVSIRSNVAGANSAIVTANTAMKSYVDAQVGENAYSNVKVSNLLPVYSGNIAANSISATQQISTSGGVYSSELSVTGRSYLTTSVRPANLLGSVSGNVQINALDGDFQTLTTSGPITISEFTNWPATGTESSIILQISVENTAHTVTFPSVVDGTAGITGFYALTSTWTAPAVGKYLFTLTTVDGGTTVTMSESNPVLRPFNSTAESITNTGNAIISLGTTYSTYRTSSNGTAFLGNGVAGQIKVITTVVPTVWVVNVESSTWPSGRVTFFTPGQAITCTWNPVTNQWVTINIFGAPSFS